MWTQAFRLYTVTNQVISSFQNVIMIHHCINNADLWHESLILVHDLTNMHTAAMQQPFQL